MRSRVIVCALSLAFVLAGPPAAVLQRATPGRAGELAELNAKIRRFAPTVVTADAGRLSPADQSSVAFDAFFTHVLAHELMHGLGPHNITAGGSQTTVRRQLKELYSAIEEAKADVTGLWALQYLIDKGAVDKSLERTLYTTFLASMFRSVRFGIKEAHGRGVALQFNYLTDEGAIRYDERAGTFSVNPARVREAVRKLAGEILTIQAEGSYERAKALLDRYAVVRPPMQRALERLKGVPVDIEPSYPLAAAAGPGGRR